MYNNGELIELLAAHPIRLMADGRTGVAYEGWVYPLLKGDVILLGEPAHEDAPGRKRRLARGTASDSSKSPTATAAVNSWTFESNGPVHYIKFDAADVARELLIARLNAAGLHVVHCVRSARPARDGRKYAWSIRLGFSGPRHECERRVRSILENLALDSLTGPAARRHRPTGTPAATEPEFGFESRPDALEHSVRGKAEAVEKLTFEILPPDSGVRNFAATIRRIGHYAEDEVDLRRLQVLLDVERHFSDRQPRKYESGFPADEDNRYVVLVLAAPTGGEDAVAISPLKGRHATFLVRHGIALRPWRAALSMTKAKAVEFGADRLIFKSRTDDGLDEYEVMYKKLVQLLDGESRPEAAIGTRLRTSQLTPPGLDGGENTAVASAFDRTTMTGVSEPTEPQDKSAQDSAASVDTSNQLQGLFRDKHPYWRSAAFASSLAQGIGRDAFVDDGTRHCEIPARSQVSSVGELAGLVQLVCTAVEARAQSLGRYVVSEPFTRLFDPTAEDPSPAAIVAAAERVVDFYEANLLLALRVRGTDSPWRYRKVIESASHLVDRNLKGIEDFTVEYAEMLRVSQLVEQESLGENGSHIVPLNLYQDNKLLARILRRLRVLSWVDVLQMR